MMSTVSGFALLLVLAVAILPVPRVRRWLLTALARLRSATVLACLGACGTLFAHPQAAPPWVARAVGPLLEGTLGISLDADSGLPWLLLAVAAGAPEPRAAAERAASLRLCAQRRGAFVRRNSRQAADAVGPLARQAEH